MLRYVAQLGRPLFKADGSIEVDLSKIKGRKGRRFCRSVKLTIFNHNFSNYFSDFTYVGQTNVHGSMRYADEFHIYFDDITQTGPENNQELSSGILLLIDEILQGTCKVYEGCEKDLQEDQKDKENGSEKGKRVKKTGKRAN